MRSDAEARTFFKSYASVYRNITVPETTRLRLRTDPHAPGQFRVDTVVSNMPAFVETFRVTRGTPMFRSPRATLWTPYHLRGQPIPGPPSVQGPCPEF